MRQLTKQDRLITELDQWVRALLVPDARACQRPSPGDAFLEQPMTLAEKRHIAGLMRVNHAGEVCAQALYRGQGLTATLATTREQMHQAAAEEIDHLAWCETRLHELSSHPSVFNLLWYSGSFVMGAVAGLLGDRWSLGFVAETEQQVSAHLVHHLNQLPSQDDKTRAILQQMNTDELAHADAAKSAGAAELPSVIKWAMQKISLCLTRCSYYF
jgi:ubiquinone biosynthesis monooxygenase Coq7